MLSIIQVDDLLVSSFGLIALGRVHYGVLPSYLLSRMSVRVRSFLIIGREFEEEM